MTTIISCFIVTKQCLFSERAANLIRSHLSAIDITDEAFNIDERRVAKNDDRVVARILLKNKIK